MTEVVKGVNPWRLAGWGLAVFLVLMPLVALQVVPGFNWGLEDFVAAAVLVGLTGLAVEVAVRVTRNIWLRIGLFVAIFLIVATVWAELSVGLMR